MTPNSLPTGDEANEQEGRNSPLGSEEDRPPPSVSLAEVLTACRYTACRYLETEGQLVTRRSVRDRLGRGSMTTIHKGVSEFERQRVPEAPRLALTAADREVISDLGARALAVAEERVQTILAEREGSLRASIDAADARAADAITAADALVAEAERRALAAEAAVGTALAERDAARATAEQAEWHALRLDGQAGQLAADKAAAEARAVTLAEGLAVAKHRADGEVAFRERAEANVRALETALAGVRVEYAARAQEDADTIAALRQGLAITQARLDEVGAQRDAARATAESGERELAARQADLAAATGAAARTEATVAAHSQTIARLSADLAAARNQVESLSAAPERRAQLIAALEEAFTSMIAGTEERLITRIATLHSEVDAWRREGPTARD
ncbi:MAG: DNA-binding protein [Aliidongia sp.]